VDSARTYRVVVKVLTANDTGQSGGHQAGILIPKKPEILQFFPALDPAVKNPRAVLRFVDEESHSWLFTFIYYNNRFFGGTRNEYRLTGMTAYLRSNRLSAGDEIALWMGDDGIRRVAARSRSGPSPSSDGESIVLGSGWRLAWDRP